MPITSTSFAIETHPARLAQAGRLRDRLAPFEAMLAVDPDPTGPKRAMRSARIAFGAASTDFTHHIVLQDDVWVPDGFADAVRQAAEVYPDAIISLFANWGSLTGTLARWAAMTGATAVPVIETYVPTQAAMLPSRLALEFAHYLNNKVPTNSEDDTALLHFARLTGTPTLVLVPNLVEHLDVPSLVGNDWKGIRRSACVLPTPLIDERAEVLESPALVPFVEFDTFSSMMVELHPYGYGEYRPTVDVLADWGIGEHELRGACRSALASWPEFTIILERASESLLFEVWVTAAAMGAIQAQLWPTSSANLHTQLTNPVFAQSLRTMAPGALRRAVDPDSLAEYSGHLVALIIHGMTYGAEAIHPDLADLKPADSHFQQTH